MKHKMLIVDDEPPSREELAYLISGLLKSVEILEASNGEQALEIAKKEDIEVAFIDINMPGMDGIALSREINKLGKNIKIVFATAYDLYAVKAFEMDAVDYILKPFEEERIRITIDKLLKGGALEEPHETRRVEPDTVSRKIKKLSLWKGDRVILVDIGSIVYIQAEERNTIIKTLDSEYCSNQAISALEEKLGGEGFFRVHRSFLINLEYLKEVQPWFNGGYVVKMQGYEKDDIPVSRKQVKEFKDILGF